jgi:hypothetical protein
VVGWLSGACVPCARRMQDGPTEFFQSFLEDQQTRLVHLGRGNSRCVRVCQPTRPATPVPTHCPLFGVPVPSPLTHVCVRVCVRSRGSWKPMSEVSASS